MQFFYSNKISDQLILLDGQEMIHCIKVLRKKVGDCIFVTDGKGNLFYAKIVSALSNKCELKILEKTINKNDINIHLLISPTKNHKRIDWMVEKLVEVGIQRITFILCKNSIRTKVNLDRLNKIALAAMKQTQNTFLPIIDDCIDFNDIFKIIKSSEKYIAHLNSDNAHLHSIIKNKKNRCILIGPEGDFTEDEVKKSITNGFREVSLGTSRLRTETSGLLSSIILNLKK
mgnify:CR=1 FL=1|tara:strand:+ start:153 stop:842 length:690 start_codon:yes stop_codon:yes gene_type:complete